MKRTEFTLVFIPGLLSDRRVWEPAASLVSKKFTQPVKFIEFDLEDNITRMAETVLDETGGPLVLLGHSMGARVALEAARLAGKRIEALALFDTGTHPLKPGEIEKRQAVIDLAYDQGMSVLANSWLPQMLHEKSLKDKAIFDPLFDMVITKTPQLHERQIHALINRPDAVKTLESINCPVLLGVGNDDKWSPVSQHREMQSMLPSANLAIIEDAGHFSQFENPAQAAFHILNWLASL